MDEMNQGLEKMKFYLKDEQALRVEHLKTEDLTRPINHRTFFIPYCSEEKIVDDVAKNELITTI